MAKPMGNDGQTRRRLGKFARRGPYDVSIEEFARMQNPPLALRTISRYVWEGRVPGARLLDGAWHIDSRSEIAGIGRRARVMEKGEGLSPLEYAEMHGVVRQRVYALLSEGRIEGAEKTEWGWQIPEDAPWPGNPGHTPSGHTPRKKEDIRESNSLEEAERFARLGHLGSGSIKPIEW